MHYRWINLLRSNKVMQVILGSLPSFLVLFYCIFYLYDLTSIFSVITLNNKMAEPNLKSGLLAEVEEIQHNDDTADYTLKIVPNELDTTYRHAGEEVATIQLGLDAKYFVMYFDTDIYVFNTLDFISVESVDSNSYTLNIDGNLEEYNIGDDICTIYVSEADNGKLFVKTTKGVELSDYEISNITISGSDDWYYLALYTYSEVKVASSELSFVTILPTDKSYFDFTSNSLLINTTEDFWWNYMLSSKLQLVLCSAAILSALLVLFANMFELPNMNNKVLIVFNVLSILFLALCIFITYSLLGSK